MTTSTAPDRQRWLIPALIVLLSSTIGGGLLARELYRPADLEPVIPAPPTVPSSLSAAEQPGPTTVELTCSHKAGKPMAENGQVYRFLRGQPFDQVAVVYERVLPNAAKRARPR